MVKDFINHSPVFYLKQMTNQQVKQELGKTLNKNLKSIGEAILSENLMGEHIQMKHLI